MELRQGGQNYAYLYDGNGNVEAVLDNTQAVVAAYRYDPFGVLLDQTGSLTQPYGFSTKRYDPQIGMIHYEFRDYLPALARWTTRDPLGEAGGMNLYAFVGNNPLNWVDPWGLTIKIRGGIGAKIRGAATIQLLRQNSPTAAMIIRLLESSPTVYYIELIPAGGSNSYDPGTDTCRYNPELDALSTINPACVHPWCKRPPEIGLVHELIHALHDNISPLAIRTPADLLNEENKTVGIPIPVGLQTYSENKIRDEYGLPLRPSYRP